MREDTSPEQDTDPEVYRVLLESTRAIPWRIDWQTLGFTYIGPQIEPLLGWPRDSWQTIQDWADRIHPEDRDKTVEFCVSQSKAGSDHEADYRALTANGDYVWIRDVVHVMRNASGEAEALVGFMFDISERKKTEQELVRLKQELEALTLKDSLTGIGNRRQLDAVLDVEWANARRQRQPLSLIILDIDHFKQYNDHYGHLKGDDCLKLVALTLKDAARRPRDFFGRFGGEEFVFVLPDCDKDAAAAIAERCRTLIRQARIHHPGSPAGRMLTISLGVGTTIPDDKQQPRDFVERVDRQLYMAKQRGRDQVVAG